MVKRIGGFRRKTRRKLAKKENEKGKISITRYLQSFKEGERVCLKAEPAIQRGMYLPRFHGRVGVIKGMRGGCYEVMIRDGNKEKKLIVHPVHLRAIKWEK